MATASEPTGSGVWSFLAGFTISGYTYSQDGVARLLSRLNVLPDLHNVQLQTSSLTKVGTQDIVQFTILADVAPPGAAS